MTFANISAGIGTLFYLKQSDYNIDGLIYDEGDQTLTLDSYIYIESSTVSIIRSSLEKLKGTFTSLYNSDLEISNSFLSIDCSLTTLKYCLIGYVFGNGAIRISNFTLKNSQAGDNYFIYAPDFGVSITIENSKFFDIEGGLVNLETTSSLKIRDSEFRGFANGLFEFQSSSSFDISGSIFSNKGYDLTLKGPLITSITNSGTIKNCLFDEIKTQQSGSVP